MLTVRLPVVATRWLGGCCSTRPSGGAGQDAVGDQLTRRPQRDLLSHVTLAGVPQDIRPQLLIILTPDLTACVAALEDHQG